MFLIQYKKIFLYIKLPKAFSVKKLSKINENFYLNENRNLYHLIFEGLTYL